LSNLDHRIRSRTCSGNSMKDAVVYDPHLLTYLHRKPAIPILCSLEIRFISRWLGLTPTNWYWPLPPSNMWGGDSYAFTISRAGRSLAFWGRRGRVSRTSSSRRQHFRGLIIRRANGGFTHSFGVLNVLGVLGRSLGCQVSAKVVRSVDGCETASSFSRALDHGQFRAILCYTVLHYEV
jgi:hypothetical protein